MCAVVTLDEQRQPIGGHAGGIVVHPRASRHVSAGCERDARIGARRRVHPVERPGVGSADGPVDHAVVQRALIGRQHRELRGHVRRCVGDQHAEILERGRADRQRNADEAAAIRVREDHRATVRGERAAAFEQRHARAIELLGEIDRLVRVTMAVREPQVIERAVPVREIQEDVAVARGAEQRFLAVRHADAGNRRADREARCAAHRDTGVRARG